MIMNLSNFELTGEKSHVKQIIAVTMSILPQWDMANFHCRLFETKRIHKKKVLTMAHTVESEMLSKRSERPSFLQSKPHRGNTTVLYASLVSQICKVRRLEICGLKPYPLQSVSVKPIWQVAFETEGLFLRFAQSQNIFVQKGNVSGVQVGKQYGCGKWWVFIWCLSKCFAAETRPTVMCHQIMFSVTSCWLQKSRR